jgi:hypothetical protein
MFHHWASASRHDSQEQVISAPTRTVTEVTEPVNEASPVEEEPARRRGLDGESAVYRAARRRDSPPTLTMDALDPDIGMRTGAGCVPAVSGSVVAAQSWPPYLKQTERSYRVRFGMSAGA